MSENLITVSGTKEEQYQSLLPQLEALVQGESNKVANMANIAAALKTQFDFFWVGFYLVDTSDELVLGPFQGPIACTRIKKGRGVCGTVWQNEHSLVVPDVDAFPGHIACSSLSRSEVVVPLIDQGRVIGVLDVDSDELNDFDEVDQRYLERIVSLLVKTGT
ncbi:GAF domain-containing protein [Albibacterium indicum]|uniref:GAF domain-containing protein n=1 Tax=Albibacterium indicum TaxID=2292082 RepID=UPI000E4977B5|nr:GAF domain-containing protein [Pedobacter indicus]